MNELNDVAKGIKVALMLGVATSAMPLVASANAEEEKVERIEVTGSRIARTELSQPSPVIVMDAAEIARMGTPDLGQMLSELPAIGATDTIIGNNNSNGLAGTSSADLRRLGSNRTLVLVNGKRHVAGNPGEQTVDLSTIHAALIERVEVITGGASAIYGSDAVSGVINVILKDDYDGFEFNATGTKSTEGVNERNHTLSILAGTDFADGRGNVNFFTGYTRIGEVMSRDIRQFEGWGTIINPDNTGEDDGIPDRLRVRNVWSEMIHANGEIGRASCRERVYAPV